MRHASTARQGHHGDRGGGVRRRRALEATPSRAARRLRWRPTGGWGLMKVDPCLDGVDAPLVVVDTALERAVLAQEVSHLAHGTDDGDELRRNAHFGLGLTALDTVEALVGLGEPRVDVRAQRLDADVRRARLVANAFEDLDGQVGRLHGWVLLSMPWQQARARPAAEPGNSRETTWAWARPRRPSGWPGTSPLIKSPCRAEP